MLIQGSPVAGNPYINNPLTPVNPALDASLFYGSMRQADAFGSTQSMGNLIYSLFGMLLQMFDTTTGGAQSFTLPADCEVTDPGVPEEATVSDPLLGGLVQMPVQQPPVQTTPKRRAVIAQIDSFQADNTGFNHGLEIAEVLQSNGDTDLIQFPANNGGQIADALENIVTRVQNGETIDAVELPQQDFTPDADTARVQTAIKQLAQLNVPVVVAAGNGGPQQQNALGTNNAFVVQNIENGALDSESGPGNIRFEGRTTSFASAGLAVLIAAQHAAGLSIAEIRQSL